MMWGYDGGASWGWWLLMSISMVAFWTLVIVGLVALVNWSGGGKRESDGGAGETPEQTLARRLASGEINQEQYRTIRDELRGRPPGPTAAVH